jgi:hypothetical protein
MVFLSPDWGHFGAFRHSPKENFTRPQQNKTDPSPVGGAGSVQFRVARPLKRRTAVGATGPGIAIRN